jgi:hypothetical protein
MVKPSEFSAKNAIWENAEWAPGKLHLEFRKGKLCFFLYGSDYQYFDYKFTAGEVYKIGLVYDAEAKYIKLFVNSQLAETKSFTEAVPIDLQGESHIGGYGSENRFFTGQMHYFRVWTMALEDGLVITRKRSAISGREEGLFLCYWLDEIKDSNIENATGHLHALLVEKDLEMPEMLRFGMNMEIPENFSNLTWYGRGPHENYQDRNTSAFVGLYKSTVNDQYFPYIRPQENGYKTDTRWLALQDSSGKGLMFIGEPLICFSALNFTIDDLDQDVKPNYQHINDLVTKDFISLNVDYKQTGVGGDDSWGARPHPQYTLEFGEYEYTFTIRPLRRNEDLMELSKKRFKLD